MPDEPSVDTACGLLRSRRRSIRWDQPETDELRPTPDRLCPPRGRAYIREIKIAMCCFTATNQLRGFSVRGKKAVVRAGKKGRLTRSALLRSGASTRQKKSPSIHSPAFLNMKHGGVPSRASAEENGGGRNGVRRWMRGRRSRRRDGADSTDAWGPADGSAPARCRPCRIRGLGASLAIAISVP